MLRGHLGAKSGRAFSCRSLQLITLSNLRSLRGLFVENYFNIRAIMIVPFFSLCFNYNVDAEHIQYSTVNQKKEELYSPNKGSKINVC